MKKLFKITSNLTTTFCIIIFISIIFSAFIIHVIFLILHHYLNLHIPKNIFFSSSLVILGANLSILIANFFSKEIFKSIRILNNVTKEVSKGNFEIYIEEFSNITEINELEENFNIMTGSLKNMTVFKMIF